MQAQWMGTEGKSAGGNGQHVSMKLEMSGPTLSHAEAPLQSGPVPPWEFCLGSLA